MIRAFRHRGLKRLYEKGDQSHVDSELLDRIEDILVRLDVAVVPLDLDLPGYGLHQLKGKLKGYRALKVSLNRLSLEKEKRYADEKSSTSRPLY